MTCTYIPGGSGLYLHTWREWLVPTYLEGVACTYIPGGSGLYLHTRREWFVPTYLEGVAGISRWNREAEVHKWLKCGRLLVTRTTNHGTSVQTLQGEEVGEEEEEEEEEEDNGERRTM